MNIKRINITLLTIVVLILIVVFVVFLFILFYYSNNIDRGSISDWFNVLISFCTLLLAAYIAFAKAPEWISQKHYDVAYGIIEKVIFKDLNKLRSSSFQLKNKMIYLGKSINKVITSDIPQKKVIDEMLNNLEIAVDEYHSLTFEIINQLKSISRIDYELTPYTTDIMLTLQATAHEYNELFSTLFVSVDDIEITMFENELNKEIFTKNIIDTNNKAVEYNVSLSKMINSIFEENKPISHFIFHKKKIKTK